MKAIFFFLFSFGMVLAGVVGQRMTADAQTVVLGVFVGVVGSVPVALVLLMLHRANERQTARVVVGITSPTSTEALRSQGCEYALEGRKTSQRGYSTFEGLPVAGPVKEGQFREYASSVPRVVKGSTTVKTYKRNRLGPGAALPAAVEIVHSTPHREPNAGSDLVVPLGQAVVSAAVAALLCGVLAAVAGRTDVLRVVAVAFVAVLAAAWLWRLGVVDSLLHAIETITQELDGADEDPEPDPSHGMVINAGAARADAGRRERSSDRALRLA